MHAGTSAYTLIIHFSLVRTPARPQQSSAHTMRRAHCRMITRLSQCASHWWAMCLLILLAVQESSAASHKCHFRVRRFDRVLTFPYKSVLMVD